MVVAFAPRACGDWAAGRSGWRSLLELVFLFFLKIFYTLFLRNPAGVVFFSVFVSGGRRIHLTVSIFFIVVSCIEIL